MEGKKCCVVKEGEDDHTPISQRRGLAYCEPRLWERNRNSSFNFPLRLDRCNCWAENDLVSRAIGGLVFAESDEKSCEICSSSQRKLASQHEFDQWEKKIELFSTHVPYSSGWPLYQHKGNTKVSLPKRLLIIQVVNTENGDEFWPIYLFPKVKDFTNKLVKEKALTFFATSASRRVFPVHGPP